MLGSYFYLLFLLFMTRLDARGITSMMLKRLKIEREMILDRVTLKQGKSDCGR